MDAAEDVYHPIFADGKTRRGFLGLVVHSIMAIGIISAISDGFLQRTGI
jgi:hypothetical protein